VPTNPFNNLALPFAVGFVAFVEAFFCTASVEAVRGAG